MPPWPDLTAWMLMDCSARGLRQTLMESVMNGEEIRWPGVRLGFPYNMDRKLDILFSANILTPKISSGRYVYLHKGSYQMRVT